LDGLRFPALFLLNPAELQNLQNNEVEMRSKADPRVLCHPAKGGDPKKSSTPSSDVDRPNRISAEPEQQQAGQ
jgi:hypothetical protein